MSTPLRSRDFHVRRALTALLATRLKTGARLVHELGLNAGNVRVDVAVISTRLEGYEIKSDRDTLVRLRRQATAYGAVLDRCTLVLSAKHVEAAAREVPEWWGLMVAEAASPDQVNLRTIRKARANPSLDPTMIVKLLWREEALRVASNLIAPRPPAKISRAELYALLTERLSLTRMRREVRDALMTRRGWRQLGRERRSGGDSFQLGSSIREFHASPLPPNTGPSRHPQR